MCLEVNQVEAHVLFTVFIYSISTSVHMTEFFGLEKMSLACGVRID